jgi:hypothetical protein
LPSSLNKVFFSEATKHRSQGGAFFVSFVVAEARRGDVLLGDTSACLALKASLALNDRVEVLCGWINANAKGVLALF